MTPLRDPANGTRSGLSKISQSVSQNSEILAQATLNFIFVVDQRADHSWRAFLQTRLLAPNAGKHILGDPGAVSWGGEKFEQNSVGRPLHRYRRGHGFESCLG